MNRFPKQLRNQITQRLETSRAALLIAFSLHNGKGNDEDRKFTACMHQMASIPSSSYSTSISSQKQAIDRQSIRYQYIPPHLNDTVYDTEYVMWKKLHTNMNIHIYIYHYIYMLEV